MSSQMNPELDEGQRQLAEYMSGLSEQAYYAGWMTDLEYALWYIVRNGPRQYGRADINDEHVMRLRKLSERCGGWIIWDDEAQQEIWIPLQRWIELYEANRESSVRFYKGGLV